MQKHTNELIHSSSPYLLQHAHNPVNWVEWSQEAFEKAKKENKLVLISAGYSACHWCHVMEDESFKDEAVAELMNTHLVCIKVDREERPDIDHLYMDAVQLMTQQGGWPLNCFTLPDGRPIYGGTYFPKGQWMQIIKALWKTYTEDYPRVEEYAKLLTEGIIRSDLIEVAQPKEQFEEEQLIKLVQKWKTQFDTEDGGDNRAPKFPLPNNIEFLLRYGYHFDDKSVIDHAHNTLEKIAFGGIYDQLKGGFARYSVDAFWKVPHFEKMAYDNGQLLSIYAKAYTHKNRTLYKETIEQTIDWLLDEMRAKDNGFYSALDADSEGEEGKFYTWPKEELTELLPEDMEWFSSYYNINEKGYWEDGKYILLRTQSDEEWCEENNFTLHDLNQRLKAAHKTLNTARNLRTRPGLDDKQITSWNAMLIKGLVEAGLALQNPNYIEEAKKTALWITAHQLHKEGYLYRIRKDGKSKINGFLEDYAHVIDAFICLHESTFEPNWLILAKELTEYTLDHFYDEKVKMFYFTTKETDLLSRKLEINDNVIPASNSVMANNLFRLGKLFHTSNYIAIARQMLSNVYQDMPDYGSGYSNWGILALNFTFPYYEVLITGSDALEKRKEIAKTYIPNAIYSGGAKAEFDFLNTKDFTKEAIIYVCEYHTCQSPTTNSKEAIKRLK